MTFLKTFKETYLPLTSFTLFFLGDMRMFSRAVLSSSSEDGMGDNVSFFDFPRTFFDFVAIGWTFLRGIVFTSLQIL